MGRPTTYAENIANEICERLSGGESLLQMCHDEHIPHQSVIYQWLLKNPTFQEKYARAREFWAEAEFEKMMEIADTPQIGEKTKVNSKGESETTSGDMTEHRRLQVDTRKWALARMSPKKYGDKVIGEGGGGGTTFQLVVMAAGQQELIPSQSLQIPQGNKLIVQQK